MRFFIGAIVSTLILSPASVLSMVLDTPAPSSMTQFIGRDGAIQRQIPVATTPIASSLQKRFCIGKCSKQKKALYQCKKKYFSKYQIKKAKNAACSEIKTNRQKGAFPSLHTALKFGRPAPYFEWPIKRNGRFWNRWSRSKYRVILTEDCEVVGAAIRNNDGSYIKCSSKDDDE